MHLLNTLPSPPTNLVRLLISIEIDLDNSFDNISETNWAPLISFPYFDVIPSFELRVRAEKRGKQIPSAALLNTLKRDPHLMQLERHRSFLVNPVEKFFDCDQLQDGYILDIVWGLYYNLENSCVPFRTYFPFIHTQAANLLWPFPWGWVEHGVGSERYESVRLAPGQHGQQNGVFINWYYFYTRDYLEYIIHGLRVKHKWKCGRNLKLCTRTRFCKFSWVPDYMCGQFDGKFWGTSLEINGQVMTFGRRLFVYITVCLV